MGFFSKIIVCPNCGSQGAIKTLFKLKCPTPGCVAYDPSVQMPSTKTALSPDSVFSGAPKVAQTQTVRLDYLNFEGKLRQFEIDPRTLRKKGRHISVCLAGQKRRISLAKDRIQNKNCLP